MLLIKGVSLAKRKTQCSLQMIKLRVKRIVTCTVQTSISRGLDIKFYTEMYAPNFLRFIHSFLSLFWSDKFTDFILMSWQPFNEETEFNFPFRAHFEINHKLPVSTLSQWGLGVKTSKLQTAEKREWQIVMGFNVVSDRLRGWHEFSGLTVKRMKRKPMKYRYVIVALFWQIYSDAKPGEFTTQWNGRTKPAAEL